MTAPGLVLVAHGTRNRHGVEMIAELADAVSTALLARPCGVTQAASSGRRVAAESPALLARPGGVTQAASSGRRVAAESTALPCGVRTAFVDVLGPTPAEVLRDMDGPAVVVPAFLASGYHVHVDVPREVAASGHPEVAVTRALGPHPELARVMVARLRDAGRRPGDAVVFAAAGSSDARARADVRRAAGLLGERIGDRVHVGYVATGGPRVPDVVARLRASGHRRVFIASYLLAHGLFHQRLHEAGATGVAEPIGVHPGVVDLIMSRYHAAQLSSAA